MEQALLRVVPPPVGHVGVACLRLAGLVVDVGADMGAVGGIGFGCERAFDVLDRGCDLADLALGEVVEKQLPALLARYVAVDEGWCPRQ